MVRIGRLVLLLGCTAVLALGGCGGGDRAAHARPSVHRPAPPPLVYLHRATGADPVVHETTITRDGRVTVMLDGGRAGGGLQHARLGRRALARMRRLVAQTRLAHANRSSTPSPGGSAYILRIGQRTATFSTGHVARGVQPLLAALVRLSDRLTHNWTPNPREG